MMRIMRDSIYSFNKGISVKGNHNIYEYNYNK